MSAIVVTTHSRWKKQKRIQTGHPHIKKISTTFFFVLFLAKFPILACSDDVLLKSSELIRNLYSYKKHPVFFYYYIFAWEKTWTELIGFLLANMEE